MTTTTDSWLTDRNIRDLIDRIDLVRNVQSLDEQIQPVSIDLRLDRTFKVLRQGHFFRPIKMHGDDAGFPDWAWEVVERDSYVIPPDGCVLAQTVESIHLPNWLAGDIKGRSSIGRLFLNVHSTAGLVDPGFEGHITLEITNHSPHPIELEAGRRVAQCVFIDLGTSVDEPYEGKYIHQDVPTTSKVHLDTESKDAE